MLTCTGSVIAVHDLDAAAAFWTSTMGFVPAPYDDDGGDDSTFLHRVSGQRITLVEIPRHDPAMALAVRVDDVDDAFDELADGGFDEHWSDTSPDGDEFCMCRNDAGVFILLYRPAG